MLPKIIVTSVDGLERVEMDGDYYHGSNNDNANSTFSMDEINETAATIRTASVSGSGDIGTGLSELISRVGEVIPEQARQTTDAHGGGGGIYTPASTCSPDRLPSASGRLSIPTEAFTGLKVVDPVMELWRVCTTAEKARSPFLRQDEEAAEFQRLRSPTKEQLMPEDACKDENEDQSECEDEEYDEAIKDLACKLVNTAIGGAVEICLKE